MKKCTKCQETKDKSEFWRDGKRRDGLQCWCKRCLRNYRQSDAGRASMQRADIKRAHDPRRRAERSRKDKRRREKHPDNINAVLCVYRAVKAGRIPRVSTRACSHCGNEAEQYHHHKGYSKKHWLTVIPLCRTCHTEVHRQRILD